MLDRLRKTRGREEGFTLIELLIVIIILGILAAIVVFAVGGITSRGADAACKSDVSTAQIAVEAYRAQNGSYPATLAATVPGFMHTDPTGVHGSGQDAYTIAYSGAATHHVSASGACTIA